jgi:hypothetical protein
MEDLSSSQDRCSSFRKPTLSFLRQVCWNLCKQLCLDCIDSRRKDLLVTNKRWDHHSLHNPLLLSFGRNRAHQKSVTGHRRFCSLSRQICIRFACCLLRRAVWRIRRSIYHQLKWTGYLLSPMSQRHIHTPMGTSYYCSLDPRLGIFHTGLRRRYDRYQGLGKHYHYRHCILWCLLALKLRRSLGMCNLVARHWSWRSLHKTYTFRNHERHPS